MTTQEIQQPKNKRDSFGIGMEDIDRFFNLALDLLTIASTDGYLLKINKAWEHCLGYTMAEMEGKAFLDFVHPDDRAATIDAMQSLVRQEVVINFVNRYRTIDGTYRYIEWRSQPYGKYIYAAARDITESRIAAEKLRESEALFRSLFEQSNDAVIITDMAGKTKLLNQRAADLLGYTLDEAYQLTAADISDDLADTKARSKRLREGDTLPIYERSFRHKDGTMIPVEINASLIRDSEGNPLYYQSIIRDIRRRIRNESKIRQSEQQFRALFEQSNDAVFMLDFQARHIAVNQRASEMLGYSVEELQKLGAIDISADPQESGGVLARLLAGEKISPYERRFRHKDGTIIPVEINVELVYDGEGQPLHLQSVVRDISERKAAESALEMMLHEERLLKDFLKSLQDIVIELTDIQDLNAFYKRAVELGLERFGFERFGLLLYDAPDAVGTYGTDAAGQVVDESTHRFDPKSMTTILWRALQREEHFVFDEDVELYSKFEPIGRGQNAVAVLWHGAEQLGWLCIDNAVYQRPINLAQLEILALYALSIGSLLAQKRIQAALSTNEQLYRSIVTTMAEGLVLQDADGKIITANATAEQILGLTVREMQGRDSFDPRWRTIHEDGSHFDGSEHPAMLTLRTGKAQSNVILGIHRPDNTVAWISINSSPIFHPNDVKPYAVVVTFTDITRRREAQQQALELQLEKERMKILSNFIQGSSHEFRTPLAIIKSNSYLLKRLDDPQKRGEKIHAIEYQVQRILKLLEMLTKMSQLDSNVPMLFKTFQLQSMLENLRVRLQSELIAKNIQLQLIGADCKLYGNEEALFDAFFQLIENAIQFSKTGSEIRLHWLCQDQRLVFTIEDDGIGMSAETIQHIFERFYRLDAAHSTAGFGLGLALAQSIILKHGGAIAVQSKLNQGTAIEISLPLS